MVKLKHIGSAHTPEQLALLIEAAHQQLIGGQLPLFAHQPASTSIRALKATSAFLFQTLQTVYRMVNFNQLEDTVFEQLVLTRLDQPASKFRLNGSSKNCG